MAGTDPPSTVQLIGAGWGYAMLNPTSVQADNGVKVDDAARLVRGIRTVLRQAINAGGTTLRDYLSADGAPGYFRQRLYVYERRGKPCRRCRSPVRAVTQGQRSTYYCPSCQK